MAQTGQVSVGNTNPAVQIIPLNLKRDVALLVSSDNNFWIGFDSTVTALTGQFCPAGVPVPWPTEGPCYGITATGTANVSWSDHILRDLQGA